MTPSLDQRSAARILDLAESRGSRSSALMGFALILLFAAHAALTGGFPRSAQAAAMSPAGVRIHARESAQMNRLMAMSAAAVVTAGASAQNAVQWRVEDGGNGHWYVHLLVTQSPDWSTAASACLAIGGHLATITSQQENQFVFGLIKPTSQWPNRLGPWLGGYRGPAGWTWVTGEQWSWTNWAPFEPNNTCGGEDKLHFIDFSPTWNDVAANGLACGAQAVWSYVVEWSADCNGDGIVDYGQIRSGELADANVNNIPDCCENGSSCCPGDTNNDGFVDGIDLATILAGWAQSATKFPNADCNRDGVIDGSDLSIVLGSWGVCP